MRVQHVSAWVSGGDSQPCWLQHHHSYVMYHKYVLLALICMISPSRVLSLES